MKSLKRIIFKKVKMISYFCLYYSGLLSLILRLYKLFKKDHKAVILLYHQIVDRNTEEYIFKSHAVHHHLRSFKAEMRILKKWFDVVSLDSIIDHIKEGKQFSRPTTAITFDDGYRDNYTLAYPVMREFRFPATIYLTTGLINTNKRTWVDTIEYALLKTKEKSVSIPELFGDQTISIATKKELEAANSDIGEAMKKVSESEKLRLINELYNRLGVEKKPEEEDCKPRMLSWDEIKEMKKNHISFGSHTNNHPVLTKIPIDKAKEEILSSTMLLKEKVGEARHFAFPNGTHKDFNEELNNYCKEIGLESIATAEYGIVDLDSNPHYMGRFIPQVPIYMFAAELVRLFILSGKFAKRKEYDKK